MERPLIGVGIIVRDGNKVLIGKRKNSHGTGTWSFPGGHLEFGESILACAERELLEETDLKSSRISYGPFTNDIFEVEGKHYVTLFLIADYQGGMPRIMEPHKCEEWRWCAWSELPSPLFLPIQNLLKQGFRL